MPGADAATSQSRVRILFLAANPETAVALDLEEEIRSLEGELRAVDHRDDIELIQAPAARPDDVIRLLREDPPTIVHFSGHGSQDGIILRTESAYIAVSGPALAEVLGDRGIKLVVLNSCFSDLQAEALAATVPALVGTTAAVGDEAARRFSTAFYRTIGNGHAVGEAFRDGRDAVVMYNLGDVFRMRGDADLVLFGQSRPDAVLTTTADLVGVMGRLTTVDRLVLRAILKSSTEIRPQAFREFFRAPNAISGRERDGYRFRLAEMVDAPPAEQTAAVGNLLGLGLITQEELTDILYKPSPDVVAIVNRSAPTILGLLYSQAEVENRPVEIFNGNTRYKDGKPDLYADIEGVPLQGPYRLDGNTKVVTYFEDGKIVDPPVRAKRSRAARSS
jgi:hypothetical protein